ncbi:acyl-CoA dehydrogenase family protein [Virgifigura deserti]|uniref:acyl-CoA dehydrogenase family protein n=1 Tax=Virgifigura deserti TaxID=2268457 RepID=UPI003CCC158A
MAIDFSPTDEQRMLVETVRQFVEKEIFPYEAEVDRAGDVPEALGKQIRDRAMAQGLYAANMPESVGGGGLDAVSMTLFDRELGKATWGLAGYVGRPSEILMACAGDQIDRYLTPCVRGERKDCFALSEPDAGSDAMAITTRAERRGGDWVLNGTKHFISGVGTPDFAIVFAVTGVEESGGKGGGRPRKRITAFLVDRDTPGFEMRRGPRCVSYRTYNNYELSFTDCRIGADQVLGEEGAGFDLANRWLSGTRILVAATCCGKAERALTMATEWAATRKQFGQTIGRFQGTSFKLADMATELRAADLLTLNAAWKYDHGTMTSGDAAMAKLFASEMLGRVTDNALQIFGGMGLMEELPVERFWRDARIERIWEGTSEIQRHIISRELLRPLES